MRVVIAGGAGLIGRHLAAELVGRGDEVVVLSRTPGRALRLLPPAVVVERWDPRRGGEPLVPSLRAADAVVNLAGESVGRWPWTAAYKRTLRDSRLRATNALVDGLGRLAAEERPLVMVSASGTHMYEDLDAEPATEVTPPTDDNFLGRLCLEWEAAALRAAELGVRVVIARTSLVVAGEAPALRRLLLPFRLLAGGSLGTGEQWLSWVAIDDAVGLICHALRAWDVSGPLNLSAPQQLRQREFAAVAARVLRRPAWLGTPAWLIRLVMGEQTTLALGSRRVWPAKALHSGYEFRVREIEDALRLALARPGYVRNPVGSAGSSL